MDKIKETIRRVFKEYLEGKGFHFSDGQIEELKEIYLDCQEWDSGEMLSGDTEEEMLDFIQNTDEVGNIAGLKTFYVPCVFSMCGRIRVRGMFKDHHEAMDYAERNINRLPLPDTDKMAYLEDSFEIDKEGLCCDEAGKIIMDTES